MEEHCFLVCSSWLVQPDSYTIWDQPPRGRTSPSTLFRETPPGLAHSTVWWGHFLNSCSLFPNNSNLCGVDLRTSQHKGDSLRGNKWSEHSLYCYLFLCVGEFLRIKMCWMGSDDQHYGLPDYQHSTLGGNFLQRMIWEVYISAFPEVLAR